jgi:hypothetical protein
MIVRVDPRYFALALKHEFQLQTFEERAIENTSVLLIF